MIDHKTPIMLTLSLAMLVIAGASQGVFKYKTNGLAESLRADTIENFDDGVIELFSYPDEDFDSSAWALDSDITYNNSPYSLKLWGNTWKVESIVPIILDSNDVWQVAAYVDTRAEIQGFGVMDTANILRYSFAGTQQLNPETWVPVYQGAFPLDEWNQYQLPVGQDWLAYHDYLPTITAIVFINDRDNDPDGVVYFDDVLDITADLPMAPQVSIDYVLGEVYNNARGTRLVDIHFFSTVLDTDSWYHDYYWYFGDDSTSNEPNPFHTYVVEDDHSYTVLLEVVDSTNQWGRATCQVTVDPGPTSFPLTMNFVGDIMLARRYEQPGGIIPTLGVEAIFEPTLPYLGNAADITVANLECPLTDTGTQHPTKPIYFRGSPENVAGLAYAGIDVVSLANNHIIDYGLEGMRQTQVVLDSANILYSGAGANSYEAYLPLFLNKKGTNIAFLASSERTGQYDNYQPYLNAGFNKPGFANLTQFDITRQIQAVENDADIIVMEMHSGDEYNPVPTLTDYDDADYDEDEMYSPFLLVPTRSDIADRRHAIDEGADLVICHHVHVLQGLEVYNGNLIAHSLGDFTFDLNYPETYPSMILNAKIDDTGLYEYGIVPVYVDDYIPVRAQGELGLYILDYLARRSRDMDTYVLVDRDSVTAQVILDTLGLTSTSEIFEDSLELTEEDGVWISNPLRIEKRGDISSLLSVDPWANWQFRVGREAVWFGNFEDEGCTMWLLDHPDEFYDDSIYYAGARSLCHFRAQQNVTLATHMENRLPCPADTAGYTLYGYIKTDNGKNAEAMIRFYQWRTSGYALGSETTGDITGTNDWALYYKNFVPANGTNFFDVWLRSEGPDSGDGHTWFDNVGVIEWSDWQPFNTVVDITTPNDFYWIQIRTALETYYAFLSYEEKRYYPQTDISNSPKDEATCISFSCYPNPAHGLVTFQYYLAEPADVKLRVYNTLGQEVRELSVGNQSAGLRTIQWDGSDNHGRRLSAGVYFCRMQASEHEQSKKVILLK
ncbi:MAG: CapA family protein [candidate division WOR-3 bacterium]|jgi:poly-gamma-glutamate synthesis protein (capsule biosynthesis protein)